MAEVFLGGSKPLRFLSHFVLGVEFFSQKFGVTLFIKAFWKFGIEFSRPPKSFEDPFHPTCDWQSSWTIENCQIILGVLVQYDFRCSLHSAKKLVIQISSQSRFVLLLPSGYKDIVRSVPGDASTASSMPCEKITIWKWSLSAISREKHARNGP